MARRRYNISIEEAIGTDPFAYVNEFLYSDSFDPARIKKVSTSYNTNGKNLLDEAYTNLTERIRDYSIIHEVKRYSKMVVEAKNGKTEYERIYGGE